MTEVIVPLPVATGVSVDQTPAAEQSGAAVAAARMPLAGPRRRVPWWATPAALALADLTAAAGLASVAAAGGWVEVGRPALVLLVLGWGVLMATGRSAEPSLLETRLVVCTRVLRAAGAAGALVVASAAVPLVAPGPARTSDVLVLVLLWAGLACLLRIAVPQLGAGCRRSRPPLLVVGAPTPHRTRAIAVLEGRLGTVLPRVEVSSDDLTAVRQVAVQARALEVGAVIAIPGEGLDPAVLRRLRWETESTHLPFFVDPGVLGVSSTRLEPSAVGGLAMVRIREAHRHGPVWTLIGVGGRIVAGIGLLLLLPFLLAIAVAVTRTSPGPAIYRQVRVGRDGREFTILKFRTMTTDTAGPTAIHNDFDDVLFKMRADPRITPLGRWLRRYSVDELPQLANVVLGQMRLVGPRPALPGEVEQYADDDRRRLAVQPGITGLWQVSGRSDLDWEETVRLDLHYVDNWSPTMDLVILFRTVGAVLGHHGAY